MIRWLTAFIDVPDESFEAALSFWSEVTGATPSPTRGDRDQFVTLEPSQGTAHLRVQRLGPGAEQRAGVHLDIHVDDIDAARDRAVALGARQLADRGFAVMASPGGFSFCLVGAPAEIEHQPPIDDPSPHRLQVICLDAPADVFASEVRFWSALVDLEPSIAPGFEEYAAFSLWKQGLPLSMLVQRLGDDQREQVHAHLDISAAAGAAHVVNLHTDHGATVERRLPEWTILRDPAGLVYCITDAPLRDPAEHPRNGGP